MTPTESASPQLPRELSALVMELVQLLTSQASWPHETMEDFVVVMLLQSGATGAHVGPSGQALLSRFGERIGVGQDTDADTVPKLIEAYFAQHPFPQTLVSTVRGLVAGFGERVTNERIASSSKRLFGKEKTQLPGVKDVTSDNSLFQFLLKKK